MLPAGLAHAGGAGDHVRLGEVTLTPSVYAGIDYHSNVYQEDSNVDGAPSIVLSPRIQAVADRPDWSFNTSVSYLARKYIDPDPRDAANVQNLDRFNNVDATLGLDLLKRGVIGVKAADDFGISNFPAELQTSAQNANIRVISNALSGGALIRPGSALEFGLLGQYGFDDYKVPDAIAETTQSLDFNSRQSYGPSLDAKWKFLPKTYLFGGGGVIWNRWQNNLIRAAGPEAEGLDYGQYLGKPDSVAWRTLWGVRGQFTTHLSAEVGVGYGQAWYDEDSVINSGQAAVIPNSSQELDITGSDTNAETFARDLKSFQEGLLLRAQVGWSPRPEQSLILGYRKDFQDAYFTNYVVYNYVFLRFQSKFVQRVTLGIEGGVRVDGFHGEVARKDVDPQVKVSAGYATTKFLQVNAAVGYTGRKCGTAGCDGGVFAPSQYDDFYASLGLTLSY